MADELIKKENSDEIKLKEAIENNDVVGIWQECDDFNKLSETTIKTMQHINDEQVREFTQKLTQTNEKILTLTFEGVKKHHEKQNQKREKIFKNQLITYTILAFLAGVVVGIFAVRLMQN